MFVTCENMSLAANKLMGKKTLSSGKRVGTQVEGATKLRVYDSSTEGS